MGAPQAVGVDKYGSYAGHAKDIWHVVEIAPRIRRLIVDRWWENLILQDKTGETTCIALLAARAWPHIALVEEIGTFQACLPKTRLIPAVSAAS